MIVEDIRSFNRFYVQMLGVFGNRYLGSGHNSTEIRIIGEIGRKSGITAREISSKLGLDKGYMSRTVKKLIADGLIERSASEQDGRAMELYLTDAGAQLKAVMDAQEDQRIERQIGRLTEGQRRDLMVSMRTIQRLLSDGISMGEEEYSLRPARSDELNEAMDLIHQAKAYLKAQGIDQWQKGYPDLDCIRGDIEAHRGYFLADRSGNRLGYLCVDFDGEPAYSDLNGQWLTGDSRSYGVVHRLALDASARDRGLAERAFRLAEGLCRERGVKSIRMDTDDANGIMKHLLSKQGYTFCGTICFDNSEKLAYEKLL